MQTGMLLAVEWGPISSWLAAGGTFLAVLVALFGGFRIFDWLRRARLNITFKQDEPWCRTGDQTYWIRVRVENAGKDPAKGCIGKLTKVWTNDKPRYDIDPTQLRWAGGPNSRGFEPIDLREGEHEFLDVLSSAQGKKFMQIETFEPRMLGFRTQLERNAKHRVKVTVFADNARPVTLALTVTAGDTFDKPTVRVAGKLRTS